MRIGDLSVASTTDSYSAVGMFRRFASSWVNDLTIFVAGGFLIATLCGLQGSWRVEAGEHRAELLLDLFGEAALDLIHLS